MAMNLIHRRLCRSEAWAHRVREDLLPWALRDVPLDGSVLEIGPGYGVTTRLLAERAGRPAAVEVDPVLAGRLAAEFGDRVDVRCGDGAALEFPDGAFDTVVCFTMLHHVPDAGRQDRLFAEAARVLRPGGTFAGSDSRLSLRFRLFHVADTMVPVDPGTLPERLRRAGLVEPAVDLSPRSLRCRAVRPA